MSSADEAMIKDKIIHGTKEWYENILSIKRLNNNLVMGLDECVSVNDDMSRSSLCRKSLSTGS